MRREVKPAAQNEGAPKRKGLRRRIILFRPY
jgi:hypothetical protein